MANYKEDVSKAWQRTGSVTIKNEYKKVASIAFEEEFITVANNTIIGTVPVGSIVAPFKDPAVPFDLLHPETGAVIGSATYQDTYVLLHSLYIFLANKRDVLIPKLTDLQVATSIRVQAENDVFVCKRTLQEETVKATTPDSQAIVDAQAALTAAEALLETRKAEESVLVSEVAELRTFLSEVKK